MWPSQNIRSSKLIYVSNIWMFCSEKTTKLKKITHIFWCLVVMKASKKCVIFFQILWPFQKTFTLLYLHTSIRSESLNIRSYENLRIIDMKVCFSHPVQFDLQKSKKKCRVGVSYRQCTWWFYSCKYIFVCSAYLTFMIIYCIYSSWSYLIIVCNIIFSA